MVVLIFSTWWRGLELMTAALGRDRMPVDQFLKTIADVPRVPGLAVYLSREADGVPHALRQTLLHYHVLQECVLLLTIETHDAPFVHVEQRLRFEEAAPGMGRAVVTFGFLDDREVPGGLRYLPDGWRHESDDTSYVVGRMTVVPAGHATMVRWRRMLFRAMLRLAGSTAEYFRLPSVRVLEIGIE